MQRDGVATPIISWIDETTGETIFIGGSPSSTDSKYDNFVESRDTTSSTMTIPNIAVEDEGRYACASTEGAGTSPAAVVKVEG